MAQETMSELSYNGKKVIVEVARRDGNGNLITTTYATTTALASLSSQVGANTGDIETLGTKYDTLNTLVDDISSSVTALSTSISKKQDKLTAGNGITITNNVIASVITAKDVTIG